MIEREELGHHQTADDRQTEGLARAAAGTEAQGDGQGGHQRRHGRHHDRPEPQQATFVNRVLRAFCRARAAPSMAKSIIRMAFFFTMPMSMIRPTKPYMFSSVCETNATKKALIFWRVRQIVQRIHIKPAENNQCHQRAKSRRRQAGQNRQRMNETFVENSQNDVDDEDGHDEQGKEALQRRLVNLGRALKTAGDGCRQMHLGFKFLNLRDRRAERDAGSEVEGNGDRRQLADMRNAGRTEAARELGDRAQGNQVGVPLVLVIELVM